MPRASAGVLPPVDTWHPQVWSWVHSAWLDAGGLDGGPLGLAQVVRALWSAGDPWSRAYRALFAGAPAPADRLSLATPDEEVFYTGEPGLVEVMERAAVLGAGRIHPWAILQLVAERTQGSAEEGRPGWPGVRTAPVDAVGEETLLRVQREASIEAVMAWASGRQVIAVIVDDRVSSSAQHFATPYVEGHFHLLGDEQWVLREPAANAPFWVLEGVAPDAALGLAAVLQEVRRLVPGFVPWLPLRAGLDSKIAERLIDSLAPLRSLPRVVLTTDPGTRPGDAEADPLIVGLDRMTGGDETRQVAPILADHPLHDDVLDHESLAAGLVHSLRDEQTQTPMVLAILGPSGSGRTDLLQRLGQHWQHDTARVVHLDAHAPLLPSLVDALAGPLPAYTPAAAPVETDASIEARDVLGLLLPGAATAAPRSARSMGRAGLILACLGGAGSLAAAGHWSALIPAAALGLGGALMATGVGKGLLHHEEELAPPRPPELPSLEQRLANAGSPPPLLLLLDDLDRVSTPVAQARLTELAQLIRRPDVPPMVVALACTADSLHAAAPDDHPATSLVQVPLWLRPMRPRAIRHALSHWTGLPAPALTRTPPILRTVSPSTVARPSPVPIQLEASQTGQIGPADLASLMRLSPLIPPSPRAWKAVVNQVRLSRPHLGPDIGAKAVTVWLALAAADTAWTHDVRAHLRPTDSVESLIDQLAPHHLRAALAEVPADAWPDATSLIEAADPVLRWTLAGPYAPPAIELSATASRAAS